MSNEIKPSTVVAGIGTAATGIVAGTTASAVIGGSAATIMSATAGTTGAAIAASAGMAGTAGGGMAAGAIITAAVPVAVIATLGYGLFKLFED